MCISAPETPSVPSGTLHTLEGALLLSACFEEKHTNCNHNRSQRGICDTIWEKRNKPGLFMPQLKHMMKINAVSLIRIQAGSLYFKGGAGWTTLTINYKLDITSEVRRKPHFRCFTTFHTTIVPQTFVNIDFDNWTNRRLLLYGFSVCTNLCSTFAL